MTRGWAVRARSQLRLRRLEPGDLSAAASVSAAAFDFDISDPATARRWHERLAYLMDTDPEGGFVAELDGRVIGAAQALMRERLWCLSLLAVDPGVQSGGAGRALLEHTLGYGATDTGLIVSSNDPRALRLYSLAGFSLKPTFGAEGELDRRALPANLGAVREGSEADLEAFEPLSREIRGAAQTREVRFAMGRGARLLRLGDRGFALTDQRHGVWMLVAKDEEAATALLWAALECATDTERLSVRWLTDEQQWAIEVVLRAGLKLSAYGALAVRGRPGTLRPFIPSPSFA